MTAQRRAYERFETDMAVTVVHGAGDTKVETSGKTVNVSLGGMLLELEGTVPFGAQVKVRVVLPALKEATELAATVRWVKDGAVGVQFGSLRAKEAWALNQLFKSLVPAA